MVQDRNRTFFGRVYSLTLTDYKSRNRKERGKVEPSRRLNFSICAMKQLLLLLCLLQTCYSSRFEHDYSDKEVDLAFDWQQKHDFTPTSTKATSDSRLTETESIQDDPDGSHGASLATGRILDDCADILLSCVDLNGFTGGTTREILIHLSRTIELPTITTNECCNTSDFDMFIFYYIDGDNLVDTVA